MADDLMDLVRRDLGLEMVGLVGHSMGGRTMMLAAIRQGQMYFLDQDIMYRECQNITQYSSNRFSLKKCFYWMYWL